MVDLFIDFVALFLFFLNIYIFYPFSLFVSVYVYASLCDFVCIVLLLPFVLGSLCPYFLFKGLLSLLFIFAPVKLTVYSYIYALS